MNWEFEKTEHRVLLRIKGSFRVVQLYSLEGIMYFPMKFGKFGMFGMFGRLKPNGATTVDGVVWESSQCAPGFDLRQNSLIDMYVQKVAE